MQVMNNESLSINYQKTITEFH